MRLAPFPLFAFRDAVRCDVVWGTVVYDDVVDLPILHPLTGSSPSCILPHAQCLPAAAHALAHVTPRRRRHATGGTATPSSDSIHIPIADVTPLPDAPPVDDGEGVGVGVGVEPSVPPVVPLSPSICSMSLRTSWVETPLIIIQIIAIE